MTSSSFLIKHTHLETAMTITHYCLGNGALKCDGCGQEKNWQTLNQLPETLRLAMQKTATSINTDACILQGRPWYLPPRALAD